MKEAYNKKVTTASIGDYLGRPPMKEAYTTASIGDPLSNICFWATLILKHNRDKE